MNITMNVLQSPILRTDPNPHRHRERMDARLQAREREARIREAEYKLIERKKAEFAEAKEAGVDEDVLRVMRTGISQQLTDIKRARAEREALMIEQELQRKREDMEERAREIEERAEEAKIERAETVEDLDEIRTAAFIRGVVNASINKNNISALSRTRATLSAEAEQLSQDISNSFGPVKVHDLPAQFDVAHLHTGPIDPIEWLPTGHMNPNDFRNRHLQGLRAGIARLDTAILGEIATLYRESQAMQEAQLRISEEEAQKEDYYYDDL